MPDLVTHIYYSEQAAAALPPEIRLSDELAAPYAPRFVLVHRPDINHPGVRMLQRLCDEQFGGNYYGS